MRKWAFLVVVVSVLFFVPACNRTADADEDERDIRQVFEKYVESVNTADLTLASQVWLQSPDISVVTPLGRFKGWQSVRDDVYVNFLQKMFTERSLQPDNLAITVSGNAAWAVYDWKFTARLASGQPMSSSGWESHVYRKTEGRWGIAHLHYSVPAQPPPQTQ